MNNIYMKNNYKTSNYTITTKPQSNITDVFEATSWSHQRQWPTTILNLVCIIPLPHLYFILNTMLFDSACYVLFY